MWNHHTAAAAMALAVAATFCAHPVAAGHGDQHATAGGMDLYYSVVSADEIRGYAPQRAERTMHGGVPRGHAYRHVMIAIYDAGTKRRIDNAIVTAKVADLTEVPDVRTLEPMVIDGTVTYGNYFRMNGRGPYRIVVAIRRPGVAKPAEASFEYAP